jgi:hypothetical protein
MAATRTPDPPPPSAGAGGDAAAIVALVAVALAALLRFRHRDGIADPDAINMAAAMAHGLQPGVPFRETLQYGRLVSPGVYYAFHALSPLIGRDPARTVGALNTVALAAAALLPWPLFALFRRRFTTAVALAATLVVVLTPLVWEVGCSFHPAGPAALLLALAILAHTRGGRPVPGVAGFVTGAALGFAALCTRAEVALVAPALLLAAWSGRDRKRALAAAVASIGLAVLGFLGVAHGVSLATGGGAGGLATYGSGYIATYWRAAALPSAVVWTGFTMGVATLAVAAAGLLLRRGGGRAPVAADPDARRGIRVALLWALPTVLFWLPNQAFMMRHFLLAVPALVWIAAETLGRRATRRALAAFAGAIVIANLLVPEAIYAAWNGTHPRDLKAPNGSFFSWHRREAALIERDRRFADLALGGPGRGAGAFCEVDWGSNGYLLLGMAERTPAYVPLSTAVAFPGATLYRYRLGAAEFRLLLSQIAWALEPGPRRAPARAFLAAEALAARRAGRAVVLPRELVAAHVVPDDGGPPPLGY